MADRDVDPADDDRRPPESQQAQAVEFTPKRSTALYRFKRRSEESERRFQEWLDRYDRRFVWYIIGIGLVWVCVGAAIKLLP